MYRKLDTAADYPALEKEVLKLWKKHDIKKQVLKLNKESGRIFSFYEGPPTANGNPHAGHVLTRSLKDVYTRFKAMSGYYVPRKGGWDTHGLPVEISVEKALKISGKQDIERFGVENFVEQCKKNVWLCIDRWKEFSEKVGYSLDLDEDCYNPYENNYIESVWWSLDQFNKKGLLYKGFKVIPSCPSCQTGLSSHEVAQGYKDKTDITAVAKFRCDELDADILAWTTTPWTLPSNVALCVNGKEKYSLVKTDKGRFVCASALLSAHFKDGFELVKEFSGNDLVGKKYRPLFDFSPQVNEKGYRVVAADFVTLTDGTGVVHIAPAYGEDDNAVGKTYDLPLIALADARGIFSADCGFLAGKNIFEENENIVKHLIAEGRIFSKAKHTHSYPHCWRCKTPLIYYARAAWFIKTTDYREKLMDSNNDVTWFPRSFKEGRMGNFLKNNVDWCLTRDRFWGTPLNVWLCSDCGHYITIGSIAELTKLTGCDKNIELHKPYIDAPKCKCAKCGGTMKRESEVIDVWYDSGAMPFAQFHYPFENKEEFDSRYPADFIFEGYDQTRGWFYSLLAINTAMFDAPPMKNCLANGMVCDAKGAKMSKSAGNYADPMDYIERFGGDTVRFMFYANTQPYNDVIFAQDLLVEYQRKFLNVIYNCLSFYVLYADIDGYAPPKNAAFPESKSESDNIFDRFIISKLNGVIKGVADKLDKYMATEASRELIDFFDLLSNWYIRRCRKRFWSEGMNDDKKSAYNTLYTVLSSCARVLAPFIPFLSEIIYQTVEKPFVKGAKESVHLCAYPACNESLIDSILEERMEKVYKFCELGRSARTAANTKIRQPLSRMFICDHHEDIALGAEFTSIIEDELNVKQVIENFNPEQFIVYSLKPQLKTLGPKYGKLINQIREYLAACDAFKVVQTVKAGGVFKAQIEGAEVEFAEQDLLISSSEKQGFTGGSDNNLSVVLDVNIDEKLLTEGYCREFVSKVQNIRKNNGFNIVDRVRIYLKGDEKICKILLDNKKIFENDILFSSIETFAGGLDNLKGETVDIDGMELVVKLSL